MLRVLVILPLVFIVACSQAPGSRPGNENDADLGSDQNGPHRDQTPVDAVDEMLGGGCTETTCTGINEQCEDGPEGPICVCRPGSVRDGETCTDVLSCEANTCSGNGQCSDDAGVVDCSCDEGYSGDACEACAEGFHDNGAGGCTDDPCLPDPCDIDRLCQAVEGAAQCVCPAGEHDEDGVCLPDLECGENTCNQRGECTDSDGGVECACEEGWIEPFCEACDSTLGYHADGEGGCTTDLCLPNPCETPHQTVCDEEHGEVTCSCDLGYHLEGVNCAVDEVCEEGSCNGVGDCTISDGQIQCSCDLGYTGGECELCDSDLGYHSDSEGGCTDDPCVPNQCEVANQTRCVAEDEGYVCECDEGYHPDGVGGCTDDPCVPDLCRVHNQACRVNAEVESECYTPDCFDNNPCTEEVLVDGRCEYDDVEDGESCSNSLCWTDQTCFEGTCGGGDGVTCADRGVCVDVWCDDNLGCQEADNDETIPDDGYTCTRDSCLSGEPVHEPIHERCGSESWCHGDPSCDPTRSVSADGCVADGAPNPPGVDGPCGHWACDNDEHTFTFVAENTGERCHDGLRCTTNDVCSADGACIGSLDADCVLGSCDETVPMPASVEIAPGHLSGRVTFGGEAIEARSPSSVHIALYLRDQDTGALQQLERVVFSGSWDDGYPVSTADYRWDHIIDLAVMPGAYDVVYWRVYGDLDYQDQINDRSNADPYAYGFHVLQRDVVIGPGENRLDVDVEPAHLTGDVTFGGEAVDLRSPSSVHIALYLRDQDTGALHQIERVVFSGSWDDGYPVSTADYRWDHAIDLAVVPGTYDVVYWRVYGDLDYQRQINDRSKDDPYAYGFHVLQRDVVIEPGENSLDVDIEPAHLTGDVTFGDGPIELRSPSSVNIALYLRDQDTGALQQLERVVFSGSWDDGYPVSTADYRWDHAIDLAVMPGIYDVVYWRVYGDLDYQRQINDRSNNDPYAYGFHVLHTDVTIEPGENSLDIDIEPARLSGDVTFDGDLIDLRSPSSVNIALSLRDHDTGALHQIERVVFSGSWDDGYPVSTADYRWDHTIDLAVLPGTYDLGYWRVYGDLDYQNQINDRSNSDPYAYGFRVLNQCIEVW